jgi:CheY-like chemotaxis protein
MAVKILMADGNPVVLELARASTSTLLWCELVTTEDGCEASKLLHHHKFDGVVIGDRIRTVSGFELIQHLRHSAVNSGIPIVMLAAEDDIDTMRRGFKAGVTFFVATPSSRERFFHLFNAVRGAMESEKRRHYRLPYHTSVTCTMGDQGKNRFAAESVEISEGGISVRPSGGAVVGQVLELEFLLPKVSRPSQPTTGKRRKVIFAEREAAVHGPQKVRARVRYITTPGDVMGLDFQGLSPAQRQIIQNYIGGS